MSQALTFTGERFLPECAGEIVYEHWHRYAMASRLAKGRRVLDIACGEGYGTALLSVNASFALGIDIARQAVIHAKGRYARHGRCAFALGSCVSVPAPSASFDLIVSFETIEHVEAPAQKAMLAEFARVLAPGGAVLLSSPNKALYSDASSFHNEFHVHELYRDELAQLLKEDFPAQSWFGQKIQCISAIWSEQKPAGDCEAWELTPEGLRAYHGPEPMYYFVAAARRSPDLPTLPGLSIFLDSGETLQQANQTAQQKALSLDIEFANYRRRLEEMVAERDRALVKRAEHVAHLENLKARGDNQIAQRDAQLRTSQDHVSHLEKLVAERERLIVERDTQLRVAQDHVSHLEDLVVKREKLIIERDAQIEVANRQLLDEQEAHARMVIELREALLAKADLMSTLSGVEAERSKLLSEVREIRDKHAETRRRVMELEKMVAEKEAVIQYQQSLHWWLKLPFARVKKALSDR